MKSAIYRMFQFDTMQILTQCSCRALISFACIYSTTAWAANSYVYELTGDVCIAVAKEACHAVQKNDVIPSDSAINTGDKSYVVLKFKDGQMAVLQANTSFHITYNSDNPKDAADNTIVFSNFTGGMRFSTESAGLRNQKEFQLTTPNANIDIHNAEFLVATLNDTLYIRVISGNISLSNKAGEATLAAGQASLAVSPNTLPSEIPVSALPSGVFSQLGPISTPTPEIKAALNRDDNPKYFLCDFCTGPTHDPAHIPPKADTDNSVTGDATMFGKHNLTPSGANTGEICAFCHTPQGSESKVATPQWNRSISPLSTYRAYSTMGSATDEASGSISMACLSCHDGTQAPNIVINSPENALNVPSDEVVYIGNDLKNHHPVGVQYGGGKQNQNAPEVPLDADAAYAQVEIFNRYTSLLGNKFTFLDTRGLFKSNDIAARNDVGDFTKQGYFNNPKGGFNRSTYSGTGNGTVWWVETANSKKGRQKTDLYLFTRTDKVDSIPSESTQNRPYVECATCHDPHSANPTFLRLPGGNARSQVCLTCHNK